MPHAPTPPVPVAIVRKVLGAAVAVSLVTACGGSGPGGTDQGDPASVAEGYFQAVSDGRFKDACQLLSPAIQQALAGMGRDCATAVEDEYSSWEDFGDVNVDPDKIEMKGQDLARVPAAAFSGDPDPDGSVGPCCEGLDLTRLDGKWHVVVD